MSTELGISVLGNMVVGAAYYYLAPKFSTLSNPAISVQTRAFTTSAAIQGGFLCRDAWDTEKKDIFEKAVRYSIPFILIGGGSVYADRTLSKVNLISSAVLGTAQLAVCKLSSSIVDNWVNSSKFGAAEWEKHFGNVGPEPQLPANIEETLNRPCPFWPGKRVRDTHMLTLIPATINEDPFTLNTFSALTRNPKSGYKAEFNIGPEVQENLENKPIENSYWVLMTKDIVPESYGPGKAKGFAVDKNELFRGKNRTYEAPKVLEAVTGILTHHARRGHRIYITEQNDAFSETRTYTHCQEIVSMDNHSFCVGGFCGPGTSSNSGFYGYHLSVFLGNQEDLKDEDFGVYSVYETGGIAAVHRLGG
jgi:hypothetical protein